MRNFTFDIVHPFVCPKLLIADVDKGAKPTYKNLLLLGATAFSVIDSIDSIEEFNVQIAKSLRPEDLPFVILPGTPKSYREGEPGEINYQPESTGNQEEKAGATLRIPF